MSVQTRFLVMLLLKRLSSDFLYNELVTVLFNPSNRSLGALSFEQISDKLPSLLPVGQSILLVWQDIIAIVAATLICFVISYGLFMRREIREWEEGKAGRSPHPFPVTYTKFVCPYYSAMLKT